MSKKQTAQSAKYKKRINVSAYEGQGVTQGGKNYAGMQAVKNHSPHQIRKRSHFGTRYRITPPPKEEHKDQWGPGGLQD